jgi:hypothetical protein
MVCSIEEWQTQNDMFTHTITKWVDTFTSRRLTRMPSRTLGHCRIRHYFHLQWELPILNWFADWLITLNYRTSNMCEEVKLNFIGFHHYHMIRFSGQGFDMCAVWLIHETKRTELFVVLLWSCIPLATTRQRDLKSCASCTY